MSARKLVLSALVMAMILALTADVQARSHRRYGHGGSIGAAIGTAAVVGALSHQSRDYDYSPGYNGYRGYNGYYGYDRYNRYNRYPTGYYTYGPGYYDYDYEARRHNRARNVAIGVGAAVLLGTALRHH